jgi:hypothetical protein
MEKKQSQDILPSTGIWTIEALAEYLGMDAGTVQHKLTNLGIGVISFSTRYRKKIFRLEDLRCVNDPEDAD